MRKQTEPSKCNVVTTTMRGPVDVHNQRLRETLGQIFSPFGKAGALLIFAGLFLTGCASLPENYARTESTALEAPDTTQIGAYFAKQAEKHPGESGFGIIRYGRPAFTARVAMSDLAERGALRVCPQIFGKLMFA